MTYRIEQLQDYYIYYIIGDDGVDMYIQDIIPYQQGVNRMYSYEEAEYWAILQIDDLMNPQPLPDPPGPTGGTQSF